MSSSDRLFLSLVALGVEDQHEVITEPVDLMGAAHDLADGRPEARLGLVGPADALLAVLGLVDAIDNTAVTVDNLGCEVVRCIAERFEGHAVSVRVANEGRLGLTDLGGHGRRLLVMAGRVPGVAALIASRTARSV